MPAPHEQATEPSAPSPSATDPFPTLAGERHFVPPSEDPHSTISSDTEFPPSATPPGLEDSPWGLETAQTPPITEPEDRYRTMDTDRYATVSHEPQGGVPGGNKHARVGDYEILNELGRGGMGVVYKARQVGLKRLVALKMILGAHAGAEQIARFRSEAEAVARMQHPNIVQIYDIGEIDGQPFFSLEFVEGGSLDRKLKGNPQPVTEATRQTEVLARAVHAAHQRGIVHRDLKPANVLLSTDGVLKITDFGLAKQLDDDGSQTRSGSIVGTPSYMAPEQAEGKTDAIGPVSDVYALGAILYEMLTGRPPFRGSTVWETLDQVRSQEPVPPTRLQPKLPRDLETICLKCLQKETGKRYVSAEGLAEDLRRFQANEPIEARPVSAWERLRKWVRRKPAKAGMFGALAFALVAIFGIAVVGALYSMQKADFYEKEANQLKEQEKTREGSNQSYFRGRQSEAQGNWNEANTHYQRAKAALDALPELQAGELRGQVEERLRVVHEKLKEQEKASQAAAKDSSFHKRYSDALFHETMSASLDRQESREQARAAARAALAIYGLGNFDISSNESITKLLERDRPYQEKAQHQKLATACYELLLIWADIEAGSPSTRKADATARQRAEKGLILLARAGRLGQIYGLDTMTYHLRKARYLAQSKGRPFVPAAVTDGPKELTGRLDWFLRGLEKYHQGQSARTPEERAQRFIESVAARKQDNTDQNDHLWSHYVAALGLMGLHHWLDAKTELTICLSLKNDFVWPRLQRGFAASEYGNQPTTDEKLAESEFDAAKKDFDAALKQDQSTLAQYFGLTNRGVLNFRRKLWAAAVRDLRQATRLKDESFQTHLNLAFALQGMNRGDEALAEMNKAVALAPIPLLYRNRAKLHLAYNRRAEARADYERAIALEPPQSTSGQLAQNLLELGQLLQKDGDNRAALPLYEWGARIKPKLLAFHRFRAETLLALNRHREAGAALDLYLQHKKPAEHDVYLARGVIYAVMGKLSNAIEMYTLALTQEPANATTRCQRGWAYLLHDSVRPALEDFELCLKQDPANVDALIGTGNARIRLRELDEALRLARQAEKKESDLTDRMLYNLARIYAQAAGQLEIEAAGTRFPDRALMDRVTDVRSKAMNYLRKTTDKLPPERRTRFWETQIRSDPALKAIRGTREFAQLAARYNAVVGNSRKE